MREGIRIISMTRCRRSIIARLLKRRRIRKALTIQERASSAILADRAEINDPLYPAKRDAFARSRL
jgi:hypothetical protein